MTKNLNQLVETIKASSLSPGKKAAYLYLLASGRFTLLDFDLLLSDIDEVKTTLKTRKKTEEKKLQDLEKQASELQKKLIPLEEAAAEEWIVNSEKILEAGLQKHALQSLHAKTKTKLHAQP